MIDNIHEFKKVKKVDYPELSEMLERIENLIYEYKGFSVAEVTGVLEIAKYRILQSHED